MENHPRKNSHNQDKNKNKNKKMAIKIGGVNVGGVILLGGALAAATILGSAFLIKTRTRRSNNNNSNNHQPSPAPAPEETTDPPSELKLKKNDETHITKGLKFILPDPSNNEIAEIDAVPIESDSSFSAHNLVLDEKPKFESNGDKEPESSPLLDESAISKEEFSLQVFNNLSPVMPEDVKDNESSHEIEVILNSGEATEADNANQFPVEDISQRLNSGIEEVEKECESDWKIIDEKHKGETQSIEETESPTNDNQEVEKECESGWNIIVKKGEDSVEADNVEVERLLIEEQESATNSDQEIICSIEASDVKPPQECTLPVMDNPADSVPENVKKDEEIDRDEELETHHGDLPVIEEESPQMQLNEEQELPRTGDRESTCSDGSILRNDACEVKQREYLMEVFDSPKILEPDNVSSKEEGGDQVLIEDNLEVQSDGGGKEDDYVGEIIVEKCVVIETSHSDDVHVGDDEKIQVSEDQEPLVNKETLESFSPENSVIKVDEFCSTVAEIVEQVDSTKASVIIEAVKETKEDGAIEAACADKVTVEDNPPMQLVEEEEENDGTYIVVEADKVAVNDNPQLQFKEEEEGEDDNKGGEDEASSDMVDEDPCEKAEASSEGTGDSSMESNAEAVWPVDESMQEEVSTKSSEPKINNNNPAGERTEENGKFYADDYKFNEEKTELAAKTYKTEVTTLNDKRVNSWQVRYWIVSILVPVVLALLLVHILKPSFHQDLLSVWSSKRRIYN